MSIFKADEPLDPTPVVTTILEKTKAGKLRWEETASPDVFIASVGGKTTLKIWTYTAEYDEYSTIALSLIDADGKNLWVIEKPRNLLDTLYEWAKRIALHVDEKVEALMASLERL